MLVMLLICVGVLACGAWATRIINQKEHAEQTSLRKDAAAYGLAELAVKSLELLETERSRNAELESTGQ